MRRKKKAKPTNKQTKTKGSVRKKNVVEHLVGVGRGSTIEKDQRMYGMFKD